MALKVTFDRYSLFIDGEREFILGGSMHYFRLPSHALWRDRLRKMKEAGLNAVDVYFAWNFHSPAEGKYDFDGIRDVDALMDMVEEEGLYLIARPGPYICAEVDAGGFPGWLVRKKGVTLRCRRPGEAVYSKEYMKYVREWWEEIVPRIAKRSNLLLFQIENEYNLFPVTGPLKTVADALRRANPGLIYEMLSSDPVVWARNKLLPRLLGREAERKHKPNRYMEELYHLSRTLGVDVPIFHNDIMSSSERQRDVDIMAIDDYAVTSFRGDWRGRKHVFLGIDVMEDGHDAYGMEDPIFIAEFQGGWYDSWGGRGYDHNRKLLGVDQLDIATKSALAQRATLINYFMFCGGTTPGYMSSPDVYTSYDTSAPLGEDGLRSERFQAVKWLSEMLAALGRDFLKTDVDPAVAAEDGGVYCRARCSMSRRYVFLRNPDREPRAAWVTGAQRRIGLEPLEMKLLALDEANRVEREFGACPRVAAEEAAPERLPNLTGWRFAHLGDILTPGYDDSRWKRIPFGGDMDMDSLGFHYGFVWYRGTYRGVLEKIELDARHCWSVYVNGALAGSVDGYQNRTGLGPDFGFVKELAIPKTCRQEGRNAITILVESLGHGKDFECDAGNPRGIIKLKTRGAHVEWRARGGLVDGEAGMCPVVPVEMFSGMGGEPVALPHEWDERQGVGVYQTEFSLSLEDPMRPVSLVFTSVGEKANLYLNGMLIGRCWPKVGPQKKFYLPPGVLNANGGNHLAVAVWRRGRASGLGDVFLE